MKENKEKNEVNLVLFEDVVKKFAEDYKIPESELIDIGYKGAFFMNQVLEGDAKTSIILATISIKSILESNTKDNCLGIDNVKLVEMISEVLNSSEEIHCRCTNIKRNSSLIKLIN